VPPPDWCEALVPHFDRLLHEGSKALAESRTHAEVELTQIERRLDRLRQLLVDEVISPAEYERDRALYEDARRRLEPQLLAMAKPEAYLKPWLDAASSLNLAPFYFREGTAEERRRLIAERTCNLALRGKTLLIEAAKPFAVYQDWRRFPDLSAWLDHVETSWRRVG